MRDGLKCRATLTITCGLRTAKATNKPQRLQITDPPPRVPLCAAAEFVDCRAGSLLSVSAQPAFLSCPFNPPIGILGDVTTSAVESIPYRGSGNASVGKKKALLLKPR